MNTAKESKTIHFNDYNERTNGFKNVTSVLGNGQYKIYDTPTIPASSMWVLQLEK